ISMRTFQSAIAPTITQSATRVATKAFFATVITGVTADGWIASRGASAFPRRSQEDRPGRYRGESEDPQTAEHARRHGVVEHNGAGCDRQRVRQQRGDAGDRQSAAPLVSELKKPC